MLESDIQDIEHGIDVLRPKKGIWAKLNKISYLAELNPSYTIEEHIEVLNLLKEQKKETIKLRRRHAKQIHDLNVKFNNARGVWSGDPHEREYST